MPQLLTLISCACLLVTAVSGFGEQYDEDTNVVEEFQDTFPIFFIVLTVINFILNSLCVVQSLRLGKFKKDAKYVFILNYIVLKTIHGVFRCVSLLMSLKLMGSRLHINPTNVLCPFIFFSTFFFEFGEALMLTLIWVVLFSERNLLGFQSLYDDLKGNSSRNIRRIVLLIYYVLAASFFGITASFARSRGYYLSEKTCTLDGTPGVLVGIGFVLVFCPILFSLAQYSVFFWKVFGGERDPTKAELTDPGRAFLSFIKINCMLKVLEFLFLDIQSSQGMFYGSVMTEIFRTLGLVVIFVSAVLYLYYESAIPFMRSPQSESISFVPPNYSVTEPVEEGARAELMPHQYASPVGFKQQQIQ